MPLVSVILCTHNPRRDFLLQTLTGLKSQSLPLADWELVIVDNNSTEQLADYLDLSWHPYGKIIEEKRPGLTPSRQKGVTNTMGSLIVFVDDDNVLAPDYLAQSLSIAQTHPELGAWGGSITPQYEVEPPPWIESYLHCLALRQVRRKIWTNLYDDRAAPWGAGLSIRRSVAAHYAELLQTDAVRCSLDRVKNSMMANGDIDLAFSAIDLGLGMGLFPQLNLTHLIPASRLTCEYLERQIEGSAASGVVLSSFREETRMPTLAISRLEYFLLAYRLVKLWFSDRIACRMTRAVFHGRRRGLRIVGSHRK